MRRSLANACLLILSAPLWTACAAPPAPVVVRQTVPPGLLSCQPQPDIPATRDARVIAVLIVDLAAAGDDCRSKLGRVRALLAE